MYRLRVNNRAYVRLIGAHLLRCEREVYFTMKSAFLLCFSTVIGLHSRSCWGVKEIRFERLYLVLSPLNFCLHCYDLLLHFVYLCLCIYNLGINFFLLIIKRNDHSLHCLFFFIKHLLSTLYFWFLLGDLSHNFVKPCALMPDFPLKILYLFLLKKCLRFCLPDLFHLTAACNYFRV